MFGHTIGDPVAGRAQPSRRRRDTRASYTGEASAGPSQTLAA